MASSTKTPDPPRLYFAYGSNLSLTQMASRCPTATYHSFGVIRNCTWVIGPRGYANIVPSQNPQDIVYGMLYTMLPSDEATLDVAEGVPYAYVKQMMPVQLLPPDSGTVEALVYVDVERPGTGRSREEYAGRMNKGIRDAIEKGMPSSYVKDVIRKWVRDEDVEEEK